MNNILNLLYFINRNGFILWLDGNEIKYSQYKNCVNKNEILSIARDNKKRIN